MHENHLRKVTFPLLLATPLIALTLVVIPNTTQQAYAQEAGIRLLQCPNGINAHWVDEDGTPKDTITYKIIVKAPSIRESQIEAVREGIERWDGFVYNIEEVGANEDADIEVTLAIRAQFEHPESAGVNMAHGLGGVDFEYTEDTCSVTSGWVDLSMKGANTARGETTALKNLVAHELGHALGLGHANYEQDIMFTKRGTNQLWVREDICPSNLDVEALTTDENPYFVEDWVELNC